MVNGFGSPAAMEASCDARVVWSSAKRPVRLIIGGLMDGKSQIDIASEMKIDRFKVARVIKALKRQFASAA